MCFKAEVLKSKVRLLSAIILAMLLLASFSWYHEFYVSLTEIRYNPESERIEVSLRIFPDDMDRALMEHYDIPSALLTKHEHPAADSLLEIYLQELFRIELDGSPLPLLYLGKEAESDVMWCYLESDTVKKPEEILVNNAILTELFEDQVNIIQVYVGKWNRGMLLRREEPGGSLTIEE